MYECRPNVSFQPGSDAQGAIVAAMPAGSLVGALMVTQLADRIGRKKTIILSGLIWVIGSILQCASVVRYPPFLSLFHD